MEFIIILIALVVFAFIIYSTYSARNARYSQQKRALELKENHMNKSMDKIRAEITDLEKEIEQAESRFEELENISL